MKHLYKKIDFLYEIWQTQMHPDSNKIIGAQFVQVRHCKYEASKNKTLIKKNIVWKHFKRQKQYFAKVEGVGERGGDDTYFLFTKLKNGTYLKKTKVYLSNM